MFPLPRFLFPYRAERNRIFRSAISAYLEFEGRKIDLRVEGYSTKTTKDRIIENTLVARHPWLLSAKTERLVMDYYTGNFLFCNNNNNLEKDNDDIPASSICRKIYSKKLVRAKIQPGIHHHDANHLPTAISQISNTVVA